MSLVNTQPDHDYVMRVLASGSSADLDELAALIDEFPDGVDYFIGRRWIINAIDVGTPLAVAWMIARGVALRFRDAEGYTPLHSALERQAPERYALITLLLAGGADPDARGINDFTPVHLAAVRGDVEALRLLAEAGADLSLRTRIDDQTTALEEAIRCGHREAVAFLQGRV